MDVNKAIDFFGSATEMARRLGLKSPSAVTNWRRRHNGRVPELYARRAAEISRGKLKFDRSAYE